MSKLNVESLLGQMLGAAKNKLEECWPDIKDLAVSELHKIAQNIADIEKMKLSGTITLEKAKLQLEFQKNVMKTVLLAEKGLGLLAVEAAINAAFGVIRTAVNGAIGWDLV